MFKMTVNQKYELAEYGLGIEGLLDALVAAMDKNKLEENLDYIIQMHGLEDNLEYIIRVLGVELEEEEEE